MPTFASTNRVALSYKPEAVPGTVVTASACYALRMTGETLSFTLKKDSDKEIRSDRQRVSSTTTSAQVDGGLNIHFQYGEYDKLLEALLQGSWVAAGVNGVAAALATVTGTATTIVGTGMPVLAKGQWFKFSHTLWTPAGGSVGSLGLLRCSATVAPTATLITLDASTPLATLASGTGVIQAARLTNGTTMKTFSFEVKFSDLAIPIFALYKGVFVSKFSTTFSSGSLTEANFDFLGMGHTSATTTALHATVTPSLGYDVQNAVTGVGNIWEGGAPLTSTSIKSLQMSIDNNLRGQDAIGTVGLVGVGVGTFNVSGSLEVYFADGSLYNKFLADTYTALSVSTQDPAGNGYVFTFPRVQLTAGKITAGSANADVMASFNWEAFADINHVDVALRQTMFIDRFGAAVVPVA